MQYIITFMLLTLAAFGEFSYPTETSFELNNSSVPNELTSNEEAVLNAMMGLETQQILEKESSKVSKHISDSEEMLPTLEEHVQNVTQQITESPIPYIPNIHYIKFDNAKKEAIKEHKYVMIKVEATGCRPCETLNNLLATNDHIKSMVNQHIKAVKVNTDQENLPMGLQNMGTPTVFLIKPDEDRVVMKLEGNEAIEDLEDSLKSFVDEGYTQGLALR